MNKTLIVATAALGGVLAYLQLQASSPVKSAKEELRDNVANLVKLGEVEPKQGELVKLQLAISDYIVKKNEPPTTLEQLVPDYFDSIPINPETKKPFEYVKNGKKFEILNLKKDKPEDNINLENKPNTNQDPNQITDTTQVTVEEDFIYDPEGKRDPFKSYEAQPKEVIDESLPPLQRYDLSQLKVTAVLVDSQAGMAAIVEDATGRGYTVKTGAKIGNKNGSIVSIDEKQINVVEEITDFTGQKKQTVSTLKLIKGDSGNDNGGGKKRGR